MKELVLVISPLKAIAAAMNCSPDTLRRWIKEEGFPAFQLDGTWRAVPEDVKQWLREQCKKACQ
jgi:excisionase family DNA binding protein